MKHTLNDISHLSEVIHGDNREFLLHTDRIWDLAIDDPPYFKGPERRKFYGSKKSPIGVKRVDYPVTGEWNVPDQSYFDLLRSKTKNQIIWGANYFDFGLWEPHKTPRKGPEFEQWLIDHPTGWIVWDKVNGRSSFNDFELAWTSFDRPTVIFTYMWNGMCQGKSISEGHIMRGNKSLNEKKIHVTQKPIDLYRWTLREYTNTGQSIIDPHCGSQSSRIAAFDFGGLDYTGIEVAQVYFDKGNRRTEKYINAYLNQLKLQFA